MESLEGKTAVITGGASGIGRGSALAFAAQGANVVIADINEQRAADVVGEAQALGVDAVAVTCDVTSATAVAALRRSTIERFGGINILMNTAGTLAVGRFEDVPIAEWERTLQVNLLSVVRCVQEFLDDLIAADDAHIVNTASLAALYAYDPNSLAYNASKAAVVSLSEGLAQRLRKDGVGVTCLCPGPVATNIGEQMRFYGDDHAVGQVASEAFEQRTPEDVGELVVQAVRERRFLLTTNPGVDELLRQRAGDFERFLFSHLPDGY